MKVNISMNRRQLLASATGVALGQFAISSLGAPGKPGDLTELAEGIRTRFGIPALAYLIVTADGVVQTAEVGNYKAGEQLPVSSGSHWQLGSITKTFTATLVAKLISERKLSWDTTLGELFKPWVPEMANGVAGITIRQMITHYSGMGGDVVPWQGVPDTNQPGLTMHQRRERFIRLAVQAPLLFMPGTRYNYSNQAYNALGYIAECVTGRRYEELITKSLLEPMGIEAPVFGEPALHSPNTEPWPHSRTENMFRPVPPVPENDYGYHMCNPAGGVSLTLRDMARWMRQILLAEQGRGPLAGPEYALIRRRREDGGIPVYGIDSQWPDLGRNISHNGSNGRNWAHHTIYTEKGIAICVAINAPISKTQAEEFYVTNSLVSRAFKGKVPAPALEPPTVQSGLLVEGEALEITELNGGYVQFQNFANCSGRNQLWWAGAKEGQRLVLRARAPHAGNYRLSGRFGTNRDFGSITMRIGDFSWPADCRTETLGWHEVSIGQVSLNSGSFEIVVTAHRDTGTDGVTCHLALDWLRFEAIR